MLSFCHLYINASKSNLVGPFEGEAQIKKDFEECGTIARRGFPDGQLH